MRSSLRNKALTGVRWSAIQNWGSKLAGFVVFLILARLLAPQDFGLVAMAVGLAAIVETVVDMGFGDAIVQRQTLAEEHLHTAFWVAIAVGLALASALAGSAQAIAGLARSPDLAPVLTAISLCIPVNASSVVQQALLRREFRYKVLAARTGAAIVCSGLVGVGLALYGFGVWSLVGQLIIQSLVSMAVLWWVSSWRPRLTVSRSAAMDLAAFGVHIVVNRWLHVLNTRLYDVLIGSTVGLAAAGYYSVGARAPQAAQQLLSAPITDVGLSVFSRLAENRDTKQRAYLELVRSVMAVCVPVFVGLAVVAPHLVPIMFGDRWFPAVEVLQAIAVLGAVHSLEYVNTPVIIGAGQPQLGWRINLVRFVAAVVLFGLTSPYGLAAIAWGYVATALLTTPMSCLYALRLLGLSAYTVAREVTPSLCPAALLAGSMLGVGAALGDRIPEAAVVALEVLSGGVAYVVFYRLIWPRKARSVWEALLTTWGRCA
jgi:O-antigen/teichoic acid export membrane protein